jgi:hypothetical protein
MLAIDAIGQDPYRGEMLTGFDYRKWRVGDWRIIYAIEDEQLIVLIIESNLWIGGVNVSQKLSRHRL